MAAPMHCSSASLLRTTLLYHSPKPSALPPLFLTPAFAANSQTTSFSTTPRSPARRDGNSSRGTSALRHTGLNKKQRLSVRLSNLPRPVRDPARRSTVEVSKDHPLYAFLPNSESAIDTPEELSAHGRAWTITELRNKDWEDLYRLYWVCVRERNRIATQEAERERIENVPAALGGGEIYGAMEAAMRDKAVKKTMAAIRGTLRERWYAWENARVAAMDDEEVDLYANTENGERAYLPKEDDAGEQAANQVRGLNLGSEDDYRTDPSTLQGPDGGRGANARA